jgi:tRNA A37 threonylcarbamoyltransferase TsaD
MNLLDYKDAKNIIIWLLSGSIGLSIYAYQSDQKALQFQDEALVSNMDNKISALSSSVSEKVHSINSQLEESLREIKDICKELKESQKDISSEQRSMAIDISRLKALQEK